MIGETYQGENSEIDHKDERKYNYSDEKWA